MLVSTHFFVYCDTMVILIVVIFLILLLGWSSQLWGYRDRSVEKLSVNLDRVFDPRCLPITKRHKEGAKSAIIMVHGFPSTPYSFTYAAQRGYEAGYDVYAPLLPGFGTAVEDLYDTTFTQWYNYLKELFLEKRGEYDHLYVLGTSMGGAMTLRLGEEMQGNNAPDGLVTVAAPVFFNDLRLGAVQNWLFYFMRIVGLFTPALSPTIYKGGEVENDGDELWMGYKGSFIRGGVSFMHALKSIRKNLNQIEVPLMALHDRGDRTVRFENLAEIEKGVNSSNFISYPTAMEGSHRKHVLLMYHSVQEQLMDDILTFLGENKRSRG